MNENRLIYRAVIMAMADWIECDHHGDLDMFIAFWKQQLRKEVADYLQQEEAA